MAPGAAQYGIPVILHRARLSYRELLAVIDTRFINPEKTISIVMPVSDNVLDCDVSAMTITELEQARRQAVSIASSGYGARPIFPSPSWISSLRAEHWTMRYLPISRHFSIFSNERIFLSSNSCLFSLD